MTRSDIVISDDWKKNWQESIAVRISALVLWVVVPVVFITAVIILNDVEDTLKTEYDGKADILAFRIQNVISHFNRLNDSQFKVQIGRILQELGFVAVRIVTEQESFTVGSGQSELDNVTRIIPNLSSKDITGQQIKIIGYHLPIQFLAKEKRKNILIFIVLMLFAFGVFLMWAIRVIVHKPLQVLVNATRAVSEGQHELRLDTSRNDEFGYLAGFFNKMLDRLMDQQQQLQHSVAEAEQANKAKSAFLANMSHELRTPLNAIIGYSEILVEEASDIGQIECIPDLKKIKTAGQHLLSIISNILDLSKIEAGKIELYIEPVDVYSVVQDVIVSVQPLAEKNKNVLTVKCEKGLGIMQTDVTKLRQSIVNLIGNACKFTENGTILFKVEKYAGKETNRIKFIVSDTGIGMTKNQLSTLFQAFTQADASVTKKFGGTGLGLVINRYFCNLMG